MPDQTEFPAASVNSLQFRRNRNTPVSLRQLQAQQVAEIFSDALVKEGYLETGMSYRELFWFPACVGICLVAQESKITLNMAAQSGSPYQEILETMLAHHQRAWDGRGDKSRAGENIPLLARLAAVVATYMENMSSAPAIADHLAAVDLVCARAGGMLDPALARLFVKLSHVVGRKLCATLPHWTSDEACA